MSYSFVHPLYTESNSTYELRGNSLTDDLPHSSTLVLAAGALLLCVTLHYGAKLLQVGKRPAGLPPGPPTIPILGNMHMLPTFKYYKKYQEWGQKYGPIYSLMMGPSPCIVIQSPEIIRDLLDKRSSNYSNRPDFYTASTLASQSMRFGSMTYGPVWRTVRRVIHSILNINATTAWEPYQTLESRNMLADMLDNAAEYQTHIRRYSNSITIQMVYGFRTKAWSDPRLQSIIHLFSEYGYLLTSNTAKYLDHFPILRKLPSFFFPIVQRAINVNKLGLDVFRDLWLKEKSRLQNDMVVTEKPSFASTLYKAQQIENISDDLAAYTCGHLLEAGSNTTSDELMGFVNAMVTHPEVQRKAQEEIDRVVGPHRLPTLEDMPNLPYIRGCIKETIRWMPTTIFSMPHSNIREDIYNGYIIPANSTILINCWAMNMDPSVWPNPHLFDPARYTNDPRTEFEITMSPNPRDRHNWVFGAGRRVCQGMHTAERTMFLAMACLLWGFDVSTSDISKIDTEDLRGGIEVTPAPFECSWKVRSPQREKIIREEWQRMQDECLDAETKQWKVVPEGAHFLDYSAKMEPEVCY